MSEIPSSLCQCIIDDATVALLSAMQFGRYSLYADKHRSGYSLFRHPRYRLHHSHIIQETVTSTLKFPLFFSLRLCIVVVPWSSLPCEHVSLCLLLGMDDIFLPCLMCNLCGAPWEILLFGQAVERVSKVTEQILCKYLVTSDYV